MSQALNSSFRLPRASFQAHNAAHLRKRPATTMSTVSLRGSTSAVGDLKSLSRTLNLPGLDRRPTELGALSPKPSRKTLGGQRPSTTLDFDAANTLSRKPLVHRSSATVDWTPERTSAILAHERDFILNYNPPKSPFTEFTRAGAHEFSPKRGASEFGPPGAKEPSPKSGMGGGHAQSLPNLHKGQASNVRPDESQFSNIAQAINLPREQIKAAYDLFKKHIDCTDVVGSAKEIRLSKNQFAKLLCTMTDCDREDELPMGLVEEAFVSAGKDGRSPSSGGRGADDQDVRGGLDFGQFAIWYATHSFSETLNLNKDQRRLRELARKYSLPYEQVDQYKQNFDKFDTDKSGMIESGEFPDLLCKCAKIPEHGLSAQRVKQFWNDADTDGSGEVDFEEFMCFYRKYFDLKDSDRAGFENFYRGVRNHGYHH